MSDVDLRALESRVERLEQQLGELGDELRRALDYAPRDPEGSAVAAGRALEGLLKVLYVRHRGELPRRPTVHELRSGLRDVLPKKIDAQVETVQRLRNLAAHHNDENRLEAADAHALLVAFVAIAEWYVRTYEPDAVRARRQRPVRRPALLAAGAATALLLGALAVAWWMATPDTSAPVASQASGAAAAPEAPAGPPAEARPAWLDELELARRELYPSVQHLELAELERFATEVDCSPWIAKARPALIANWQQDPDNLRERLLALVDNCLQPRVQPGLTEVALERTLVELEEAWRYLAPGTPEQEAWGLQQMRKQPQWAGDEEKLREGFATTVVVLWQQSNPDTEHPVLAFPQPYEPTADQLGAWKTREAGPDAVEALERLLEVEGDFEVPPGSTAVDALRSAWLEAPCDREPRRVFQLEQLERAAASEEAISEGLQLLLAGCVAERREHAIRAALKEFSTEERESLLVLVFPSSPDAAREWLGRLPGGGATDRATNVIYQTALNGHLVGYLEKLTR